MMGFNTDAIHHGEKEKVLDSVTYPIFQTSTFHMPSVEEAEARFNFKSQGYVYTRGRNPTNECLEKKLAKLENGKKGLVLSSGMAAITTSLLTFLRNGDHAICTDVVYVSTWEFFKERLPKLGIKTSFVDTSDPENLVKSTRENTKVIFVETPANPTMKLTDIKEASKLAKENNAILIVDNTFMTPYFQKPLELGADIVVHSLTKFINGHSDAIGGAVIVKNEDKFWKIWGTYCILGGVLDPFAGWLIMRGIKTLGVRMRAHEKNAIAIAEFLEDHNKVETVNYPGLKSFPQYNLAKKQMRGFGGMLSFKIKGDYDTAKKFVNKLNLITTGVSLGGVESLVEIPASMVHSFLSKEERDKLGISDNLVRLSVGLEDSDDLIEDIDNALRGC